MQRRHFVIASAVAAGTVAAGAAGWAAWTPGWRDGRFSGGADQVLRVVADTVLDGLLPTTPADRSKALGDHMQRLASLVAGLPVPTQAELSDLLALLALPPARLALTGLTSPWSQASRNDVAEALRAMRDAGLAPRAQAYQALRELTVAAHFSADAHWAQLGYPGPKPI